MSKEEIIKAISKGVFPSGHENHSSYAKGYNSAIDETIESLNTLLDTYAQEIAVGFARYMDEGRVNDVTFGVGKSYTEMLQQFLTNKNEKK